MIIKMLTLVPIMLAWIGNIILNKIEKRVKGSWKLFVKFPPHGFLGTVL